MRLLTGFAFSILVCLIPVVQSEMEAVKAWLSSNVRRLLVVVYLATVVTVFSSYVRPREKKWLRGLDYQASTALRANHRLRAIDLVRADGLPDDLAWWQADAKQLEGKYLRHAIAAKQPIPADALRDRPDLAIAKPPLPPQQLVFLAPTDNPLLDAGSNVDIVRPNAEVVVPAAEVVALIDGASGRGSVAVAIPIASVAAFLSAARKGDLSLAVVKP